MMSFDCYTLVEGAAKRCTRWREHHLSGFLWAVHGDALLYEILNWLPLLWHLTLTYTVFAHISGDLLIWTQNSFLSLRHLVESGNWTRMLLGNGIWGSLQDDMAITRHHHHVLKSCWIFLYVLLCVIVGICNMVLFLLKDQNEGIWAWTKSRLMCFDQFSSWFRF